MVSKNLRREKKKVEKSKIIKELEKAGGVVIEKIKRGVASPEEINKLNTLIKRLSAEVKRKEKKDDSESRL